MKNKMVAWLVVLVLLSSSLASPKSARARPAYYGIYAQAVNAQDGQTLSTSLAIQGTSAFNNPFVKGLLLTARWADIEPLPPGVTFTCSGGYPCNTSTTITTSVHGTFEVETIACRNADENYCYDTIDQQLDLINSDSHGNNLALGLDIHAGYHSPAWLSNGLRTVNTDTSATGVNAPGVGIYFQSAEVSTAQTTTAPGGMTDGYYPSLGTLSCATFKNSGGGTSSACSNTQQLTNWIGVTGGSDGGGACHAVRLPVPWGTTTAGSLTVAPYAQLYVNMLVDLETHLNSYVNANLVSGFGGRVTLIKLGSAMSGEDAEFTLLGGNTTGSGTDILPTEVGAAGPNTATNCPNNIASYWQTLSPYYNPRFVEETWEFIANSVGNSFAVATNGILLDIDVHDGTNSTFPDIAFYESNTQTGYNYSNSSYSQTMYGPNLQDDVIFCDLIGESLKGSLIAIGQGGGNVGTSTTAGPFYSGFIAGSGSNCLTSGSHAHQPLTYSLTGSTPYQWGIEEDGLVPYTPGSTSVTGTYAHGAAARGLELSWGTNMSGMNPDTSPDGGASCDADNDGCSAYATSTLATCPPTDGGPDTGPTCVSQFDAMLTSGLYKEGYAAPYNAGNPSNQVYVLYPPDLCNPFLWPGLQNTYGALNGANLTTASLSGTIYSDCSGNTGTFSSSTGAWIPGG